MPEGVFLLPHATERQVGTFVSHIPIQGSPYTLVDK